MKHWNIGILGASDIAFKRFLPALKKSENFTFTGIASRDAIRCEPFVEQFGGQIYSDYESLLQDENIDCVYLPLPPALHAYWGEKVLKAGKHLLMEKPFATSPEDAKKLLGLAEDFGLAIHENYMFLYHNQLAEIKKLIREGTFGSVRMIRTAFTFPFRGANDFRYQKDMGGGALLDCGGYPLLLASELLGETSRLVWSNLKMDDTYQVDTAGSAVLQNDDGLTAHVFFGVDDTYRCDLEVWGSKASLTAGRIFTAPADLSVSLQLRVGNDNQTVEIAPDDQFLNSINTFARLMEEPELRRERSRMILRQCELIRAVQSNYAKA